MKILIISAEVWRDDTNGGNVLSNIFSGIDAEFAQIYCNPGEPQNDICKLYYQMTDSMILRNILFKKKIGKIISYDKFPGNEIKNKSADTHDLKKYKFLSIFKGTSMNIAREILWGISDWKNDNLKNFIVDFKPDIIFAPCYGSHIMLSMDRYISELTKKPVISYISDDHYSLKKFSISPVYWMNRFLLRRNIKKTFRYYDLTYTMTEEQLRECKKAFNCNIKILKKGGSFNNEDLKYKKINESIRLVYAGGLYLGRWKTLSKLVKAIKNINKDGNKFILEIYSGSKLTDKQSRLLNDGENSVVHGLVGQEQLKKIYKNADIALHVEGFDLKNKLITRISFSTKIIDLLASTCAVMVISWDKHSGYIYLKKENAAICINNSRKIEEKLNEIYNNRNLINEYADKAWNCGKRNHNMYDIQKGLIEDFKRVGGLYEVIDNNSCV